MLWTEIGNWLEENLNHPLIQRIAESGGSTNCTVIVTAENKQAMLDLLTVEGVTPELFTVGLSETGQEPATHYISTGYFYNEELNRIINSGLVSTIYFVEPENAMTEAGMQVISVEEVQG